MGAARLVSAAALASLLSACTIGPHYAGPPAVAPNAANGAAFVRAGDVPASAAPPVGRWWETLGDATLNRIEDRALAANPELAAATARLRVARATLREQQVNLLPKTGANALYAHARFPGLNLETQGGDDRSRSSSLDLYNLGFDASWEVDLFGGGRRAIEAARATAEVALADLGDAQVSLTAEVAQAYVELRDSQQRIALTAQSIGLQEEMLALTRQRFGQGTASRLDVERLSRQLDSTRADATPVRAQLDAYLDELATLTGEEPGALDHDLSSPTPLPLPPAQLAVGDPASLLQRRPDIRAAERTLAADTAKIGQAQAARFPSLSFMGIIGIGGTRPADLAKLDDFTALLAPQLSWNFLDFGRSAAKVREARATRDEAEAKYRSSVLTALRDAEDSLSRFRNRRATVATLARARISADAVVDLSRQRYAAGTITRIDLLDAERQRIAAEQDLSIAEAGLTGDYVTLQKSLGLGWADVTGQTDGSSGPDQPRRR